MGNPYLRALGGISATAVGVAVVFAAIGLVIGADGEDGGVPEAAVPYYTVSLAAIGFAVLVALLWTTAKAVTFAVGETRSTPTVE